MAEGRLQFREYPHNVLFPGIFLALTVLAVNMLGDGLRDTLDPRFARRRSADDDSTFSKHRRSERCAARRRRPRPCRAERRASRSTPGEIVCLVGEVGLRQIDDRHTVMGLLAGAEAARAARSCSAARTCWPPAQARLAGSCAARACR